MKSGRMALRAGQLSLAVGLILLTGCSLVERAGMGFLYKAAPLAGSRVAKDIPYIEDGTAKHKLDLFYPPGTSWPVLVFVHGGGWNTGDKGLRVGGKDVYGNIGRFYAARGIGVAVINYRLQPEASWRDQVEDVASAIAWVKTNSTSYGADVSRLFLMGHSAGGYLVSFVALNGKGLASHAVAPGSIRGVVSAPNRHLPVRPALSNFTQDTEQMVSRRIRDELLNRFHIHPFSGCESPIQNSA